MADTGRLPPFIIGIAEIENMDSKTNIALRETLDRDRADSKRELCRWASIFDEGLHISLKYLILDCDISRMCHMQFDGGFAAEPYSPMAWHNPSSPDELGFTALHCAVSYGHESVARLLLDTGAEINAKDSHGSTALASAAYTGHEGIVRLLLGRNADINMTDKHLRSPLHIAAFRGYANIAKSLLSHGANSHQRDVLGRTPMDIAISKKHEPVIEVLAPKKSASVTANPEWPGHWKL